MPQFQTPQLPFSQQGYGQPQSPQWGGQQPMRWNHQTPPQYQTPWQKPRLQPLPPQQPTYPPQYSPQQQWQQLLPRPIYQPPQQPQKLRKSRKRLWLIIGAVALILVIIIAVVSAGVKNTLTSNTATNPSSSSNTNQGMQSTSQTINTVGKPVQVVDWLVKINSVKTSKGSEFSLPKSGNTYLVVDVTVKNTSSTNQDVSSLGMFNLKDSTGQQYTETLTDFAKPPDGAVTPGSLLRGQIAYEVPLSEHTFTFSFESNLTGNDITEWHVTI
jgi:Domain of unknown function (DUF4352)